MNEARFEEQITKPARLEGEIRDNLTRFGYGG